MRRVVPGIHSVVEVFNVRPKAVQELWLKEGGLNPDLEAIEAKAKAARVKIKRLHPQSMDRETHSHQGVIAFVEGEPQWPIIQELRSMTEGYFFALDCIEDPQNVGSLMRSAWNLGAAGIFSTKDHSAGLTPGSQKVASGAFEHVPFQDVTNLHSELNSFRELVFWIYGLSDEAEKSIFEVDFGPKAIFVVGSESSGLRKPVVAACDALVYIPQSKTGQSLNAAVAGAIFVYEFRRQRYLAENP